MHDTSSIVQLTDLSRSVSNFDVILFYMYTSIVKGLNKVGVAKDFQICLSFDSFRLDILDQYHCNGFFIDFGWIQKWLEKTSWTWDQFNKWRNLYTTQQMAKSGFFLYTVLPLNIRSRFNKWEQAMPTIIPIKYENQNNQIMFAFRNHH